MLPRSNHPHTSSEDIKILLLASADETHIVFIHVGTNSLGHVVQHRCLHDLQFLVNRIKERFPVAQVLVNNILPRCDWASLDDARYYFNLEMPSHSSGATITDVGQDIPQSVYSPDGLHPTRDRYSLFSQQLEEEVGKRWLRCFFSPKKGHTYQLCMMTPLF